MESVTFSPNIKTVAFLSEYSMLDIRDEPMLFSCDLKHCHKLGGKITKEFLALVSRHSDFFHDVPSDLNIVFDCRTTLTMPGMYPSIPGWHCDDFNRGEKYGQPRLADRDKRIRHTTAIVGEGNGISKTEFITQPVTISVNPAEVWHSLDKAINKLPQLARRSLKNREIITFSQDSIHRAAECTEAGWRWFGRLSLTYRKPWNELRTQTQVYVGKNGW